MQQCVICKQKVALVQMTAGLQKEDGKQAFACDKHFNYSREFIAGWADFTAQLGRWCRKV